MNNKKMMISIALALILVLGGLGTYSVLDSDADSNAFVDNATEHYKNPPTPAPITDEVLLRQWEGLNEYQQWLYTQEMIKPEDERLDHYNLMNKVKDNGGPRFKHDDTPREKELRTEQWKMKWGGESSMTKHEIQMELYEIDFQHFCEQVGAGARMGDRSC